MGNPNDYKKFKEKRVPQLKDLHEKKLRGLMPFDNEDDVLFAPTQNDTKTASLSVSYGHLSATLSMRDSLLARHRLFYEYGRSLGHYSARARVSIARQIKHIEENAKQMDKIIAYLDRGDVVELRNEQTHTGKLLASQGTSASINSKIGESGKDLGKSHIELVEEHFIQKGLNKNAEEYRKDEEFKCTPFNEAMAAINPQVETPDLPDIHNKDAAEQA